MNALDWTIAVVLLVSVIAAFVRGLIRSLISLLGVAVGILAACWYTPVVARYFLRWMRTLALAEIIAFVLILLAVYLVAALIGRLLRGAATAVGLGLLDRLAGAVFGFVRGVLLLAALLLPLAPFLREFPRQKRLSYFPICFLPHMGYPSWCRETLGNASPQEPAESCRKPVAALKQPNAIE